MRKTQAYEYKLEAEKEIKEQRLEVTKFENKLLQREQNIVVEILLYKVEKMFWKKKQCN